MARRGDTQLTVQAPSEDDTVVVANNFGWGCSALHPLEVMEEQPAPGDKTVPGMATATNESKPVEVTKHRGITRMFGRRRKSGVGAEPFHEPKEKSTPTTVSKTTYKKGKLGGQQRTAKQQSEKSVVYSAGQSEPKEKSTTAAFTGSSNKVSKQTKQRKEIKKETMKATSGKGFTRVFGHTKKEKLQSSIQTEQNEEKSASKPMVSFREPCQEKIKIGRERKSRDHRTTLEKAQTYRDQAALLIESISIESKLKENASLFKSQDRAEDRRDLARRAKKAYEYAAEARCLYESILPQDKVVSSKHEQLLFSNIFGAWRSNGIAKSTSGRMNHHDQEDEQSVRSTATTFSRRLEAKYEQQRIEEAAIFESNRVQQFLVDETDQREIASFFLVEAQRIVDSLPDTSVTHASSDERDDTSTGVSKSPEQATTARRDSSETMCCGSCLPWHTDDPTLDGDVSVSLQPSVRRTQSQSQQKKYWYAREEDTDQEEKEHKGCTKDTPSNSGGHMWLTLFHSQSLADYRNNEPLKQEKLPGAEADDESVESVDSTDTGAYSYGDTTFGDTTVGDTTVGTVGLAGWIRAL